MKKLLFFASDYKIGLSSLLTDQLCSLKQSAINLVAVAGENEQELGLSQRIRDNELDLIRIKGLDEHRNFCHLVKQVKSIIAENDIDIVHVQNNWQLAIVTTAKTFLFFKRRIEIIYTLHGFRHNNPVKARIAQFIIGSSLFFSTDHIICMSDFLLRKFSLLSYKIHLIPLGVNNDFFDTELIQPDTEHLRLIFPAQFREGKNQDIIIQAFAKFINASQDLNASLTLPGTGHLKEEMEELTRRLGVDKQVFFPGQLSKMEIRQLYLENNVAIITSNCETFGQSIVEPYVLGRCIVTTPVGIAPEIINDGKNGFLFNDIDGLSEVLYKINTNKNIITDAALKNFSNRDIFKWATITQKYIKEIME